MKLLGLNKPKQHPELQGVEPGDQLLGVKFTGYQELSLDEVENYPTVSAQRSIEDIEIHRDLQDRIEELEDAPTKRRRVDSNPNSLLDAADSIDRIASLVKYYEGLDEFTFDESTFLEHDGDVLYHNESLSTIAASIRNRRLEANL